MSEGSIVDPYPFISLAAAVEFTVDAVDRRSGVSLKGELLLTDSARVLRWGDRECVEKFTLRVGEFFARCKYGTELMSLLGVRGPGRESSKEEEKSPIDVRLVLSFRTVHFI